MNSTATLTGVVIALGIGYVLYTNSLTSAGGTQAPPQQTIDVIDIKTNLMNIGQAERSYLAAHGTYGTLEQLNQDGPPTIPAENRGYVFSIATNGARSFVATATPIDTNKAGWPTLLIDETMTVRETKN
jgi:type IV minor pilin ComP (DNA uptake receptor)